jgi:hypothetical protein
MSAKFQSLSDPDTFPVKIDDEGWLISPTIYRKTPRGKTQNWVSKIKLIKNADIDPSKDGEIDWNPLRVSAVPILPEYMLDTADSEYVDIPSGTSVQLWVERAGDTKDKKTREIPSYPKRKCKGKKNERNPLKSAMIILRSNWNKKTQQGYLELKDLNTTNTDVRYFPMRPTNFKDNKHRLTYPVAWQLKYDGARVIAFLDLKGGKLENVSLYSVVFYSRNKKDILGLSPDHKEELLPILIDYYDEKAKMSIYLDFEAYKHGAALQDISGSIRKEFAESNVLVSNTKKSTENKSNVSKLKSKSNGSVSNAKKSAGSHIMLDMMLFDSFYPNRNENQSVRQVRTQKITKIKGLKYLQNVPTGLAKSEAEVMKLSRVAVNDGYEGIIVRDLKSPYKSSNSNNSASVVKSKLVLRIKPRLSAEYKCVGYAEGKNGKDVGAVIWICETKKHKRFNSQPNMTNVERKKIFKSFQTDPDLFDNKYLGRMITIEYDDLSKHGVPLRAKALLFRDLK